jgi:hypothetical protein
LIEPQAAVQIIDAMPREIGAAVIVRRAKETQRLAAYGSDMDGLDHGILARSASVTSVIFYFRSNFSSVSIVLPVNKAP